MIFPKPTLLAMRSCATAAASRSMTVLIVDIRAADQLEHDAPPLLGQARQPPADLPDGNRLPPQAHLSCTGIGDGFPCRSTCSPSRQRTATLQAMVVATANLGFDSGILPVADLQRLIDRLPAEDRAHLRWSATDATSALSSFLDGPKDESSLRTLVGALVRQFQAVRPGLGSLESYPELLRSELEEAWRADAATLRASVSHGAADAVDWTIRAWSSLIDLTLTMMRNWETQIRAAPLEEPGLDLPGSPWRFQALIMAAIEAVRRGQPRGEVDELVLRAFDEILVVMSQLQAAGIRLDPFRGETMAERALRMQRYAEHLRHSLSEDDMRTLDEARVRSLR